MVKQPKKEPKIGNIIFGNIRGLKPLCNGTKIDLISDLANISNSDFMILTESHLKDEIQDCEIAIDGFSVNRCDRKTKTKGGGVVIYSKDNHMMIIIIAENYNKH